jgi:hypothetical protein
MFEGPLFQESNEQRFLQIARAEEEEEDRPALGPIAFVAPRAAAVFSL